MDQRKSSSTRDWNKITYDILVKILMTLGVADLLSCSRVCHSWNAACYDPVLWKTLDLTTLTTKSVNIPPHPYNFSLPLSSTRLRCIIRNALNFSRGSVTTLIFHYSVLIRDEHLISAAKRTPNLRSLSLPSCIHISRKAFIRAMKKWPKLESLTLPRDIDAFDMFEAIGNYCKNFRELKISFSFNPDVAQSLGAFLPNLKVLSLRSSMVKLKALECVMSGLKQLEVLNISHSLIIDDNNGGLHKGVYPDFEMPKYMDFSRLKTLLVCHRNNADSCSLCKKEKNIRVAPLSWHDFQETLWRDDEVSSLDHRSLRM